MDNETAKLKDAYFIFGLQAGTNLDAINRRYKRLAMVWHPDRFPTAEGKADAQEELKKINVARDFLTDHFKSRHTENADCACKAASSDSAARSGMGPGPSRKHTKEQEEAAARTASEERAWREAAEEAERDSQQRQSSVQDEAVHAAEVAEAQRMRRDEKLRWTLTWCLGATWIGLYIFGSMALGVKGWWHHTTDQWERDHPAHSEAPQATTTAARDAAVVSQQAIQTQRRNAQALEAMSQDLQSAVNDVDKWQKYVEKDTIDAENYKNRSMDPNISVSEQNKAADMSQFRQKNLQEAQGELKVAQEKLADLKTKIAATGYEVPEIKPLPNGIKPDVVPAAPSSPAQPGYNDPESNMQGTGAPPQQR